MNLELSHILNSQCCVDLAVLESLQVMLGNDQQIFTKVVQCYLLESPQIVKDISTSIQNQDIVMLEHTAHKLKSSSAAMGAVRLSQICLQLEIIGQSGNLQDTQEILTQLIQEYENVEKVLREKI
jgi:HPt (histidine-containing phosphotransfer) domain-containing protein